MLHTHRIGIVLLCALLLVGCAGATASVPPTAAGPQARLAAAQTQFGLALFQQLRASEPGQNIIISPVSGAMALGMTATGARGATQAAMSKALSLNGLTPQEVGQGNAQLLASLRDPGAGVQLEMANAIWHKQGLTPRAEFAAAAREQYGAEIKPARFGDPAAAREINEWLARATHDRIPSIIGETDAADRLFVINALYFHGGWQVPFAKEETRPLPFTRADGKVLSQPMMTQRGRYRYLQADGMQAVALPYGNGRISLYLFLPETGKRTDQFYASLTPERWDTWINTFQHRDGTVTIPRLRLTYAASLNGALTALGMGAAFTDQADFGGIFTGQSERLAIRSVLQKTFLEMNETGTEAAAATGVMVTVTSAPVAQDRFTFTADRPFFFAIRDDRTGALLFLGTVADPAA